MRIAQLELSLPDDHLMQLGKSLLALVTLELSPEFNFLVDDFESLRVILRQLDLLPKLIRQVTTLRRLQVEVALVLFLDHGGIARVRQWARVPITHASQVVLVAAESLLDRLGLERAVSVIDDLPDGVVLNHIVDVLLCLFRSLCLP